MFEREAVSSSLAPAPEGGVAAETEQVAVLSFDIDDMSGEEIGAAADRLRAEAGVLDLSIGTRIGKKGLSHIRLMQMDAQNLTFADNSFDVVYAPYLVNCVPDPVRVVQEMRRVCKPGGKIVILNHFRSTNPVMSRLDRALSPLTVHIGFKSDLDLPEFLKQAELKPVLVQKISMPPLWSLVISHKDRPQA